MIYPFSPKSKAFLARDPKDDKIMNFLIGAVRSGKTMTTIVKLLLLCKYLVGEEGERFIIGHSKEAVMRNILKPLFSIVGKRNYQYNVTSGLLVLFNVEWKVIAAHDAGSFQAIQGSTCLVAVIDEVVNVHRTFFDMLYSRLSHVGSRLYATGNPGPPNHYLKTEYLDNPALQQDIWYETFNLDDNLSLDPAVKDRLRRSFSGVFFKRNILALWVAGEGAIFRDAFNESCLYDDDSAPPGLRTSRHQIYVGVDCGVVHSQVYSEIYDTPTGFFLDRELVWDSVKEGRQKTDSMYADDLQAWMNKDAQIIIDPSAASFRAECRNRGLWVVNADNSHDGIQLMCSMFSLGLLKIHKRCTTTIKQIENYCWDDKAAKRGEEEPLRVDDDAVDPVRYVCQTKFPAWRLAA